MTSRPLETRYGRYPVGNLRIQSLLDSLGDLESSTRWLGEWLGISGCVLPATVEPVRLLADIGDRLIAGESAIGDTVERIVRLRFDPQWPRTPAAAVQRSRARTGSCSVNALAPALVAETGMLPGDPAQLRRQVPVGRLGRSAEVADLAVAILANAYLTNQVISLDGGIHPR